MVKVRITRVEFLLGLREFFKRHGLPSEVRAPSRSGESPKVLKEPDEIWRFFEEFWKDAMEPRVRIHFEFDGQTGHVEVPADASEEKALEEIRWNIGRQKPSLSPPKEMEERRKRLEGKEFYLSLSEPEQGTTPSFGGNWQSLISV